MGGKRVGARTTSGETMHPRISSAGSTKSSPQIDSDRANYYSKQENSLSVSDGLEEDTSREKISPDVQRKSSFDIISLLETPQDCIVPSENEKFRLRRSPDSSEVPSFWHFVEPGKESDEVFRRHHHHHHYHRHHKHQIEATRLQFQEEDNHLDPKDQVTSSEPKPSSLEGELQVTKEANPKRTSKRRKGKKVQSAKVGGFQKLSRAQRGGKQGQEWLRVLTPPGTGLSTVDSANIDSEEDELIRRYFSGLSSAGSSISWAEDAMESEFTSQLMKLWEDIETVCRGGSKPEKMTNTIYSECMQWRKAFPNPDLHRFSSFQNDGDLSSVGSSTPGDGEDAAFSSLVQSLSPRSSSEKRKAFEENMSLLQTNFRALNCSTPRPNIEKSTEYVSAWLSECQNSHVPEDRPLLDFKNRKSPTLPARNSPLQSQDTEMPDLNKDVRQSQKPLEDFGRSSFVTNSRGVSKFGNEPEQGNLFSSTTLANSELYGSSENKVNGVFAGGIGTTVGNADMYNLSFGLPRLGNNTPYQNKIDESDEEEETGSTTPTEIVSFRTAVRVQRPISSRIRDHTITPLATKTIMSSSFGGRHPSSNSIKPPATNPSNFISDNYRFTRGRTRLFETCNGTGFPSSAKGDGGSESNRAKSGLIRQGHSLNSQFSRNKQQPWSRHSGDEISLDANYVRSLYENYPNGLSGSGVQPRSREDDRTQDAMDTTGPNFYCSPNSSNSSFVYFDHSRGLDCPRSLTECEDQSLKPAVSWLMNR